MLEFNSSVKPKKVGVEVRLLRLGSLIDPDVIDLKADWENRIVNGPA
jgi:hypothetical protein